MTKQCLIMVPIVESKPDERLIFLKDGYGQDHQRLELSVKKQYLSTTEKNCRRNSPVSIPGCRRILIQTAASLL